MRIEVRTMDRTRRGEFDLAPADRETTTVGDLLRAAGESLELPGSTDWYLRSERQGRQLDPKQSLTAAGVEDGELLEVVPALVAGRG